MNPHAASNVLIVEDDHVLAQMVADFLKSNGFDVAIEGNGRQAIARIVSERYDAILLDIGLPEIDGISICREVRDQFAGPIIMLTARGDEADEIVSLEVGADDYMAKPVRPRALLARLKMHLHRSASIANIPASSRMEVDGMSIDSGGRTVVLDGNPIELTTAEFDLLWLLAEQAGQVVPRDQIYQRLLGLKYDGLDRSIDLRVSRLRKKLGDNPAHPKRIKSVRGVGYILAKET